MHHGFQCKNKKQKDFIRHRSTNPQNLRRDEEFLHMTPRTQSIKEKIGKLNFIKIKDFCSLQMTLLKRMKYQDREQVKILTNYIFNKEFISRICKESLKFKSLKKSINRSVNKHIMEYYSAKKWKINSCKGVKDREEQKCVIQRSSFTMMEHFCILIVVTGITKIYLWDKIVQNCIYRHTSVCKNQIKPLIQYNDVLILISQFDSVLQLYKK